MLKEAKMSDNDKKHQLAMLMIDEIEKSLARGTRHYNKGGKLLKTPQDVLECLLKEGSVGLRLKYIKGKKGKKDE
jgi:hypothetical protein